jgi:hypothetical protein
MFIILIMALKIANGKQYFRFIKLVNGVGSPPALDPIPLAEYYFVQGTT